MGNKHSTEHDGETCSGCGVACPPNDFEFDKACDGNDQYFTYSFWDRAAATTSYTVSQSATFGESPSVGMGMSTTVTKGEKLFKYFRPHGVERYYCSECFVKQDKLRAQSVFLDLAGEGKILTKEFQLVPTGGL